MFLFDLIRNKRQEGTSLQEIKRRQEMIAALTEASVRAQMRMEKERLRLKLEIAMNEKANSLIEQWLRDRDRNNDGDGGAGCPAKKR